MIEIYTDGSFNNDNLINDNWCGGVGLVLRVFDDVSPMELVREEFYALRYTYSDLLWFSSQCDGSDTITSTLIECIAFKEGLDKVLQHDNGHELIKFYVDDSLTIKVVNTYINIMLSGGDIAQSECFGFYMQFLSSYLPTDVELLKRITVEHICAHQDNKYNNMADSLASYKSSPITKVLTCLSHQPEVEELVDKKQYFLIFKKYFLNK